MMMSLTARLLERNVYATWTRCGDRARWSIKDFCQCQTETLPSLVPSRASFDPLGVALANNIICTGYCPAPLGSVFALMPFC